MEKETKMLATLILEVIKTRKGWIPSANIKTKDVVDDYIEQNKVYKITTDEEGDVEKVFDGYKDEHLHEVLMHIKTSIDRDRKDYERYRSEISQEGLNQLDLIEKMVRHYGDVEQD